ncbi:amino acid permease [Brevundimonas sp.]|jgi:ethanolamine permease|uniref:amino acid permease n=1 Tax=Brevundimonas sp. TaxID=1871086 RepID=UPI0037C02690
MTDAAPVETEALKRSKIGWVLLAGLGVSYVIGGDFSAWNFGLERAGWGGMMLAVGITAVVWLALMATLAELSSILPTAGGGFAFAEAAFGPVAGRLTGFAILVEYGAASAVVAIFFEAYWRGLFGFGGWPIVVAAFAVPVAIHLRGAKEAIVSVFILTTVAIAGILLFGVAMAPSFDVANLIEAAPGQAGHPLLPAGLTGVWLALPFATAFFLAVEGIAMAAEEVEAPQKTLPKAMIAAVVVLGLLGVILLLSGPGGVGVQALSGANDPLPAALRLAGRGDGVLPILVSLAALVGLGACLFSAIYAFSRQAFALSRAGYLPERLSAVGTRGTPVLAILVPSALALAVALIGGAAAAEGVFVAMVLAAMVSYVAMTLSHIRLRSARSETLRPYKTPGGVGTAGFACLMSMVLLVACCATGVGWSLGTMLLLCVLVVVFRGRGGPGASF